MVEKLKLEKMFLRNNWNYIDILKKENQLIFDIENWLWKYDFDPFCSYSQIIILIVYVDSWTIILPLDPPSSKFYNRIDIKLYIPGVCTDNFLLKFFIALLQRCFFTWIVVLIFKCRKHDLCDLHPKIQQTKMLNIISSFINILASLFSKF